VDSANVLTPLNVPALLRAHHLHPKKSLGQNFLVDPGALKKVVASADLNSHDVVLEIGAGLGSLTRYLAQVARKVVVVEIDHQLFPVLEQVLAFFSNVTLVEGDMLDLDPLSLMDEDGYLVVANIPYYISSALIRHLLESSKKPFRMVLTVQREVGKRICATPKDMNLLALSVQVYGAPRIVGDIPAKSFFPSPEVDSSIVRIDLYTQPIIQFDSLNLFFKLARAGFNQKRKTLRNSLSSSLHWDVKDVLAILDSAGIDPQRRAETLYLDEWKLLVEKTTLYQATDIL
jgi:16S rRNA (adenine1518-N6/adenine1519-N6)-dimethyltransferase